MTNHKPQKRRDDSKPQFSDNLDLPDLSESASAEQEQGVDFVPDGIRPKDAESEQVPALDPRVGGISWRADLELGRISREKLGHYLPRIAGATSQEHYRLLVKLAEELYDLHAVKRIELVRPGQIRDAIDFDAEHFFRAGLAIWQSLDGIQLDDAEREAVDMALAGCKSRWMAEAIRRVGAEASPRTTSTMLSTARTWEEITICFLSDERVQITNGTATETRNYGELGFASKKNGSPVQAWGTLRTFARYDGVISIARDSGQWAVLEKRVQEIRSKLKAHFNLTDDPIRFIKKTASTRHSYGYHTNFRSSCGPSFDS